VSLSRSCRSAATVADVTAEPLAPVPDEKDWTWVLHTPCPECGFDATALGRPDIAPMVRSTAAAFAVELARPDAGDRPRPRVWSVLEYGCHVRDVCTVFDQRLRLMLTQDDPHFPNWDQDATALTERYWSQDCARVAAALTQAAESIAQTLDGVAVDQWLRCGHRSNGSVFTVDSLARYFLHDLRHHLHDVGGAERAIPVG
jgi:DinB superfamily